MTVINAVPSSEENFSYERVINLNTVIIPQYQQMIVHMMITVEGLLIIEGNLSVFV